MHDIIVLISNRHGNEWATPPFKEIDREGVMSVDYNGNVTCGFKQVCCFYILDEQLNANIILNKIGDIYSNCKDKSIFLAVHNDCFNKIKIVINNKGYRYKTFSHGRTYSLWNDYLEPYIKALIMNDDKDKIKSLFEQLRRFDIVSIAHRLRADILTPFIPFHLYYQNYQIDKENKEDNWGDIFKSCCMEINKEDNGEVKSLGTKLAELLKLKTDLPENMKTAPLKAFYELKEYFMQDEDECIKTKDCSSRITKFADCLENVVNYVEFGDTSECL